MTPALLPALQPDTSALLAFREGSKPSVAASVTPVSEGLVFLGSKINEIHAFSNPKKNLNTVKGGK